MDSLKDKAENETNIYAHHPSKGVQSRLSLLIVSELKALGKYAEHSLWNRIYSMDLSTSIVGSKVLSIPVIWLPGLLLLGLAVWWLRMPKKVCLDIGYNRDSMPNSKLHLDNT